MSPLVSVCIPSYKQATLLNRCLRSIAQQDYKAIEVIISDDTPDDSVKIIVEKYNDELQLKYFKNTPSLGTPANWNAALDKASGDLLMLLHHDDWLANSYSLSHAVALLNLNPTVNVLFGKSMTVAKVIIEKKTRINDAYFSSYYKNPVKLLVDNVIGPPGNLIMRKEVKQRYNTFYKWLVDLEFYIQLLLAGHRFIYMDEPLIEVGLHEGQMTNYVHQHAAIIIKENVFFAKEYEALVKGNIEVYDHFWRLFRNHHIGGVQDILQTGLTEKDVPVFIQKMVKAQSVVPAGLLKNGITSKLLMAGNFLLNK